MVHFKGKQRRYTLNNLWVYAVLSWAIVMALLIFFLSSSQPALSAPVVGDIRFTVPSIVEAVPQPVPYQWWDTSTWLNGWYDMYTIQAAIGDIDAAIAYQERQENASAEIDRQMRINDWREGGKNYILLLSVVLSIMIGLAVAFAIDKARWWRNG